MDFDLEYYGYPEDAIALFEVNKEEFAKCDTDGKKRILTEA